MAHEHHHCGHCCEHEHEHHHEHQHKHQHEHEHKHEHHHEHEEGSLKSKIALIVATAVLLVGAVLIEKNFELETWQLLLVYLVPYILIGHETLGEAWEGITEGDMFNEHFLMAVATIGALCIGFLPGAETEFPEAVFVMLFFQVGELFEGFAEGKSRDSISHLMDIRPDVAHVEMKEMKGMNEMKETGMRDEVRDVSPEEVAVGSVIVVRPGEKIPLDGQIISGTTALNTVALTGESMPRDVTEGDEVISGCINLSGVIRVRTTKDFGESTVSKIIRLVESADEHKSQSESFITRFARIYTPIVVFVALALTIVPPVVSGFMWSDGLTINLVAMTEALPTWIYRALIFLVVSCPCALVISVPLTFFGGLGGASRKGILIKGSNYMDVLAKIDTVVFDKTGTLTHGEFAVEAIHGGEEGCEGQEVREDKEVKGVREEELLHLAAHVEHFTTHPIGAALRNAFPNEANDGCSVTDVEEIAGHGIRANVAGRTVCVGNSKMMEQLGVEWRDCHHTGTIIHVAIAGSDKCEAEAGSDKFSYAGHIVINDRIKADSADAIAALKALGIRRTVMLTGDRQEVAQHVAEKLGIDEYHAELLPADKVKFFAKSQVHDSCKNQATCSHDSAVAFVGDGINDAPVLKRADVGIAMGGLGSDAAIEAADVVLMDDQPSKIATAIRLARRTIGIARQNVAFAIGVKVAVLLLATVGIATMWLAVFADVGVTVLAVLNAMRALRA